LVASQKILGPLSASWLYLGLDSLILLLFHFVREDLVLEELTVALEVAGVLSEHVDLHRSVTLAAGAPQVGALVV
jgi:hypothetical protein